MSRDKKDEKLHRRRVRAIRRELSRAGVMARVDAVQAEMLTQAFQEVLQARIDAAEIVGPLRSDAEIGEMALALVQERGVFNVDGVQVLAIWKPADRQLLLRARAAADALIAAEKAASERRPSP